jgi:hypothetical protein
MENANNSAVARWGGAVMDKTKFVLLRLPNGSKLHVEVTDLNEPGAEGDTERAVAGFAGLPLKHLMDPIEGVSQEIAKVLNRIGPKKASIEFGIEVGLEAGQLTALLVKGNGKANLKITLHWEHEA